MINSIITRTQKILQVFPDKKDMTYWILFLVSLLIFMFVLNSDDPTSVNSKLSLTATIFSLALAIIAIIFSFVQSSDSGQKADGLTEKVSELSLAIERLMSVKTDMEKSNKESAKRWDGIDKTMQESFSEVTNSLAALAAKMNKAEQKAKEEKTQDEVQTEENVEDNTKKVMKSKEFEKVKEALNNSVLTMQKQMQSAFMVSTIVTMGKRSLYNTLKAKFEDGIKISLTSIMSTLDAEQVDNSEESVISLLKELQSENLLTYYDDGHVVLNASS